MPKIVFCFHLWRRRLLISVLLFCCRASGLWDKVECFRQNIYTANLRLPPARLLIHIGQEKQQKMCLLLMIISIC